MLRKLLNTLVKRRVEERMSTRRADLYRNFIRKEAKIGGELFGEVQPGGRREFFCLDRHTWIWHEEWIDAQGQRQIKTTRYDVRPGGILKAQDGQHYQRVTPNEANRLYEAMKLYRQRVKSELYYFV